MSGGTGGGGYELTRDDDSGTLVVAGDIEGAGAQEFEAALRDLIERGGGTVDLSGVTYLPSAATGPLMVAVRDAGRQRVPLRLHADAGTIADRVLLTMGVEHDSEPGPGAGEPGSSGA